MYDLFIKNGMIVDFDENGLIKGNIGLKDGKIEYIGDEDKKAKETIDAKGNVVSPGFVDIHMHEDRLSDGGYDISNYMLNMGVTTGVGGNCGNNYTDIRDFKSYIEENGAPINYMLMTGYTTLRERAGVTDRYRPSTEEEKQEMKRLYKEELDEGSIGISFGIEYSPGISTDEMIEIAKSVEEDTLLAAHYRRDANYAYQSIEELIEISRKTDLPMQISHLVSCSAFGQMSEVLELIEEAIDDGVDLQVDSYPYNAFSTRIGTSVFDDGCFENWGIGPEEILLTGEPYKGQRCTEELFHKVRKEHPDMLVVAFAMDEDEVLQAYEKDFVYVASDGIYNSGQGHPRGAGTFPRVLGRYVREGNMDLVKALKKMTLLPANRLGLDKKGRIEIGSDADLVIFNRDTIIDNATFDQPTNKPDGIDYVILAGEIVLEDGQANGKKNGVFIGR